MSQVASTSVLRPSAPAGFRLMDAAGREGSGLRVRSRVIILLGVFLMILSSTLSLLLIRRLACRTGVSPDQL